MSESGNGFSASGVPVWTGAFKVAVIGASFGGPKAIDTLLSQIERGFPVPIVICQHMPHGHTANWARHLDTQCAIRVTEAENNQRLAAGTAFIAPAGRHIRFIRNTLGETCIRLDADFADSLHVPSIDVMFSSAAQVFGSQTLAVLLGGLGSDGATGMLAVRRAGGYTIAESEQTAASYSMPGAAVGLGAVVDELPIERLARQVAMLGSRK